VQRLLINKSQLLRFVFKRNGSRGREHDALEILYTLISRADIQSVFHACFSDKSAPAPPQIVSNVNHHSNGRASTHRIIDNKCTSPYNKPNQSGLYRVTLF
jgi:hypothetical protein